VADVQSLATFLTTNPYVVQWVLYCHTAVGMDNHFTVAEWLIHTMAPQSKKTICLLLKKSIVFFSFDFLNTPIKKNQPSFKFDKNNLARL
jgi:hypothetical protein